MTREALSYIHRFEEGAAADVPPLLLLHGTGGDENDLALAAQLEPAEKKRGEPFPSRAGAALKTGRPIEAA